MITKALGALLTKKECIEIFQYILFFFLSKYFSCWFASDFVLACKCF